jgi:hypothetical protein
MGFFMAVWTTAEKAQLKEAYKNLLLGKRVVTTEVGGQQREFQRADLEILKSIVEEFDAEDNAVQLRTYARNSEVSV